MLVTATAASRNAVAAGRGLFTKIDMLIEARLERVGIESHLGAREVATLISRHRFARRKSAEQNEKRDCSKYVN